MTRRVRERAAPYPVANPPWWDRLQAVTILIALILAGAVVSWLRLPPLVRGTVWAEDGKEFLGRQAAAGFWDSLFVPYTGYLQVLPRVVTALATQLDLRMYAVAVTALCCLIVGGVAAAVYVFSGSIVQAIWVRLLLSSITVFAPMAPTEVLGNSANLHWYLLWLAPWLLLYRPRSWPAAALAASIGLVAALSEIQMVLFLPLVLVAWRDRRAMLVRAGVVLGVAAQIVTTVLAPREISTVVPPTLLDELVGYGALPVLGSLHNDARAIGTLVVALGAPAISILCALILALAALTVVIGAGVPRILSAALVGGSFVLWATAGMLNRTYPFALFSAENWAGLHETRYAVVPSMLLLAALVLTAWTLAERRGVARSAAVLVVAVVLVALTSNLQVAHSERQAGPGWSGEVRSARTYCATGAPGPVTMNTAPGGWSVVLDCDVVER